MGEICFLLLHLLGSKCHNTADWRSVLLLVGVECETKVAMGQETEQKQVLRMILLSLDLSPPNPNSIGCFSSASTKSLKFA